MSSTASVVARTTAAYKFQRVVPMLVVISISCGLLSCAHALQLTPIHPHLVVFAAFYSVVFACGAFAVLLLERLQPYMGWMEGFPRWVKPIPLVSRPAAAAAAAATAVNTSGDATADTTSAVYATKAKRSKKQ